MSLLIWFVIGVAIVVGLASYFVIKAHQRQPATGNEGMVGKSAAVKKPDFVYVEGALWRARAEDGAPLEVGTEVLIVGVDKLTLTVRKTNA